MSTQLRWRWSVLALIPVLAACNGGSSASAPVSAAPPAPAPAAPAPPQKETPAAVSGHYRGTATRGNQTYHAEGVLTADGELRLYVGGPGPVGSIESGAGIATDQVLLHPAESMLFVGRLDTGGSPFAARGTVTGQVCTPASARRFCGEALPAVVTFATEGSAAFPDGMVVTASGGDLAWVLDVSPWSIYYHSLVQVGAFAGTYRETLAAFAHGDDVILTIDSSGRLFFQSPSSGCTGNGTLAPHADGRFDVVDVDLVIANCRADYAYLNGDFVGLGTETQDNAWGYDDWLVMFLSARDGSAVPAAVTMLAELQYP